MSRFLLITRRRLPTDSVHNYVQLWRHLRHLVEHAGARAWIFHAAGDHNFFTEFIEWQSSEDDPIIDRSAIAAALHELNAAFPFEDSNTWKEARL